MRDSLPNRPWRNESAVINLDDAIGAGTHWVAFKKRGRVVLYFDSFGDLRPPRELVDYLGPDVFVTYNTDKYQDYDEYTCGHWCLKFLTCR